MKTKIWYLSHFDHTTQQRTVTHRVKITEIPEGVDPPEAWILYLAAFWDDTRLLAIHATDDPILKKLDMSKYGRIEITYKAFDENWREYFEAYWNVFINWNDETLTT